MPQKRDPVPRLRRLFYFSRICELAALAAILVRIYAAQRSTMLGSALIAIALLCGSIIGALAFRRIAKRDFRCPNCGYTSLDFAYRVAGWPWSRKKNCPQCGERYPKGSKWEARAYLLVMALIVITAAVTWKICSDQAQNDVRNQAYSELGMYAQLDAVDWAIDNAVENKHVAEHIRELTRILTDYETAVSCNVDYIRLYDKSAVFSFGETPFSHAAWIISGDGELQAPGGYRYLPQGFAEDGVIDEREKRFLLELQQDYHALVQCLEPGAYGADCARQLESYGHQLDVFSQKWSFWNVRRDGQAPLNMDSPYFAFVTFD